MSSGGLKHMRIEVQVAEEAWDMNQAAISMEGAVAMIEGGGMLSSKEKVRQCSEVFSEHTPLVHFHHI